MSPTLVFGFVLGLLSAVFFTFYIIPQKVEKLDVTTYIWMVGVGVIVTTMIPYFAVGMPPFGPWSGRVLALTCGAGWAMGTLCFATGVTRIGLALATPIKNTTGILGTLVGLVLFREYRTTDPWLCTAGSLLIVAAAIVIGLTNTPTTSTERRCTVTGVLCALGAAVCYASYLYPMKMAVQQMGFWSFAPWMGFGILGMATGAVLVRRNGIRELVSYPPRTYGIAMLGGVSWAIALICLTSSMTMVDLAVAWSLAQLNTVPAVILGILVFREVSFRREWVKISLGIVAAVVGTLLLGLAKGG